MDTLSFAFGVLIVAFIAVAVVAVVGIVKVYKLSERVRHYDTLYTRKFIGLDERYNDHMRHLDKITDGIFREIGGLRDDMDRRFVETHSYIDSRADKVLEFAKKGKEVLKG